MKVAIYHPWIYVKSGLERTIMEIKRRSRHDWTIYTSHYDREGTYPELKFMDVIETGKVSVQRRYGAVLQAAMTIGMTKLDLQGHEALVVSCDGLGSLINFRNSDVPSICLCFTPLRAVYDEEYKKRHVARYGAYLRPLVAVFEAGYRLVDRLAWSRYVHAFCITDTVKRRVVDGGLFPADKIEIAPAGVASEGIGPSDTFEPFFFLPGRIMWTKNIELGIAAFRELHGRRNTHFELVIAGMLDRKSEPYIAKLRELGEGLPIRFETNLSDESMASLYRRCHAVLFTAFNEDQGLTPLEAGMHGKPVVAVNRGGPTEMVIHGVSGLLSEPEPGPFSEAMEALMVNPDEARRMGQGGVKQGRAFTWDAFVQKLDDYLDSLATCRGSDSSPDGKRPSRQIQ